MMKKATKWTMTAVALLFVAAIATSAFGFGWGRGPGCGYGPTGSGDFPGLADLALTADQKYQLDFLRDQQLKEIEPLRQEMFAKRDVVRKLWLEATPDQAKITAAQREMSALRDQIQEKMTAFRINSLKVLTPEQQAKLKASTSVRGFGPGRGAGPGAGAGACVGGACPGGAQGTGPGVGPGVGPGAGPGVGPGAGPGAGPMGRGIR
jgi:Spy/CpxP family protein refolding chaperone